MHMHMHVQHVHVVDLSGVSPARRRMSPMGRRPLVNCSAPVVSAVYLLSLGARAGAGSAFSFLDNFKKPPPRVNGGWLARRFASSHLRVRPPGFHLRVRPGSACAHVSHLPQYVVTLARRLRTSHTVTHCRLVTAKASKVTFFSPRPPICAQTTVSA